MLRKMKDLKGFAIGAKDGDIGEANDFIFDDKNWTVRYLVADTDRTHRIADEIDSFLGQISISHHHG